MAVSLHEGIVGVNVWLGPSLLIKIHSGTDKIIFVREIFDRSSDLGNIAISKKFFDLDAPLSF